MISNVMRYTLKYGQSNVIWAHTLKVDEEVLVTNIECAGR